MGCGLITQVLVIIGVGAMSILWFLFMFGLWSIEMDKMLTRDPEAEYYEKQLRKALEKVEK